MANRKSKPKSKSVAKTKSKSAGTAKPKIAAKAKPQTTARRSPSKGGKLVERWRAFEKLVGQRKLDWALHYAPPALRFARDTDNPRGAAVAQLLPDDYRGFVEEVGYPIFGLSYYDSAGISFLPPSGMEHLSLMVFDSEGNEPKRSATGPTSCFGAFFAGYELSDVEGFAFAPNDAGELVVWSVEGAMLRDELGAFTTWMGDLIAQLERQVKALTAERIRSLEGENAGEDDPHRVIDYSLEKSYDVAPYSKSDLRLHWVEDQSSDPYRYGLIEDDGRWIIPMSKRWLAVKPFRRGTAEVILKGAADGYSGPWTRIGLDGVPI